MKKETNEKQTNVQKGAELRKKEIFESLKKIDDIWILDQIKRFIINIGN